jgi:glucose-6-phosphate dehydrogenase assembly protein OpcA
MTATTINPEKVLKDMRELWEQLAREQKEAGVLRACAMTLIVIAEDAKDAEQVRQMLGVLMHAHPSRAIVLQATEGAETSARVFAECWMPFGRQQQICSEGIEMTADAAGLGEIASVLVPLVVPDLPVVLWCRGPRFFSTRYFDPLFSLAHKIIVDSETAPNARSAITVLKEIRSRGQRIGDLAWTRLTGWRQAIANLFDDAPLKLTEVKISYAGPLSTGVLYFSEWIEKCAPSARVSLETVQGEPGICSVVLMEKERTQSVRRAEGCLIEASTGDRKANSLLPPAGVDSLVRAELSITGRDAVFDSIMR